MPPVDVPRGVRKKQDQPSQWISQLTEVNSELGNFAVRRKNSRSLPDQAGKSTP